MTIDKAFVLTAGLGTRMRPLTEQIPKPMVEVGGQTLIDRTLDQLAAADVKEAVLNLHYKGEVLENHLQHRTEPKIVFSYERELLDTGGGIYKQLKYFNNSPFFVLSGDGLWQDSPDAPALPALAASWDPAKMDILILLQPVKTMKLTQGVGDYDLLQNGQAVRSQAQTGAHMFTSMRINHPRIFANAPQGPFSYLSLLDRAEAAGRLYGIVHQGDWHHISEPKDVAALNLFWLQQKVGI